MKLISKDYAKRLQSAGKAKVRNLVIINGCIYRTVERYNFDNPCYILIGLAGTNVDLINGRVN
jgi:hypothetical protein